MVYGTYTELYSTASALVFKSTFRIGVYMLFFRSKLLNTLRDFYAGGHCTWNNHFAKIKLWKPWSRSFADSDMISRIYVRLSSMCNLTEPGCSKICQCSPLLNFVMPQEGLEISFEIHQRIVNQHKDNQQIKRSLCKNTYFRIKHFLQDWFVVSNKMNQAVLFLRLRVNSKWVFNSKFFSSILEIGMIVLFCMSLIRYFVWNIIPLPHLTSKNQQCKLCFLFELKKYRHFEYCFQTRRKLPPPF